jgi:hypothetical protein
MVHYHPAFRAAVLAHAAQKFPRSRRYLRQRSDPFAHRLCCSLFEEWKYRILVHFHPVLRKAVERYAARIVQVLPPQ